MRSLHLCWCVCRLTFAAFHWNKTRTVATVYWKKHLKIKQHFCSLLTVDQSRWEGGGGGRIRVMDSWFSVVAVITHSFEAGWALGVSQCWLLPCCCFTCHLLSPVEACYLSPSVSSIFLSSLFSAHSSGTLKSLLACIEAAGWRKDLRLTALHGLNVVERPEDHFSFANEKCASVKSRWWTSSASGTIQQYTSPS